MSRIAYVNGRYVPHAEASVHIEDRGYQFADGIYEVCEVYAGRIVDMPDHLDRLERSARELEIALPIRRAALRFIMEEMRIRNKVYDGLIYIQATRGVSPRNHAFPPPGTPSSIVMTARSMSRSAMNEKAARGVRVITLPDNRWERVDIKTTSLLPNVLAKQKALRAGADEAWFVDCDGKVTEGASTNAWIVTREGVLITRDAERGILKGVTRSGVLKSAGDFQIKVEERRFSVEEAQNAREAFITSATMIVTPVIEIDGKKIGDGAPGEMAKRLRAHFHTRSPL